MSSTSPLTAQVSDNARRHPASPPSPPHDAPLHDTFAAAAAATEPNLTNNEVLADLPQSTTSSGDVGSNIPQRAASTLAKKDRAKIARKDAVGKEPRDSKDLKDLKANGRTSSSANPPTAVDPLSHHIFARTNTDRSIASRLRNPTRPESPANEPLPRPSSDLSNKLSTALPDSARDKKKGVSFLSRFSMIGSKRKDEDTPDDESELSEQRTEGANAVAFSSAAYIPHHKEPPRYIRVRAHHKRIKEFNRIFLAQELVGTRALPSSAQDESVNEELPSERPAKFDVTSGGPIWAAEFSQDGKFLATGGRDRVLRVWAVIATEEDRKAYDNEESANAERGQRLSAPVFHSEPIREFTGHEGDILDLSWSKNNFLLSSSMDKTVRLWHMSRPECLCTYKHKDFVTSIAFHPRDDRFFLAGSLDSILRLWSIPDKAVAYSSQLSDIITAVGFSPDGKTAIAGCFNGFCMFYETEGLKFLTQVHVRSSRGKNAKGSKITGIKTMDFSPEKPDGDVKLLVTSNDSRIRIYNLADKTLETKLKGHENTCNQIRASFSDDGAFVICGSEDRKAFIWSKETADSDSREKRPCEYFEAHSEIVTTAIFAPTKTRRLLQASQDPIFTLCNPPPVTLRSKEESTTIPAAACDTQSEYSIKTRKPEETPAFTARSTHHDGNIIVTTDHSGLIKVFRQDCAFAKRRHENWETGSAFSRKLGREGLLGRTGSIMTRTSASSRDPHSRRGSLTQPLHISSDRINTWRQGVEGNPGRPLSIATMATMTTTTPARSERSLSPNKPIRTPASSSMGNPASEARRQPYVTTSPTLYPTSPTASIRSNRTNDPGRGETLMPPTPSFSFRSFEDDTDGLRIDAAGASYSFWNLNKWRNMSQARSTGYNNGVALVSPSKHERSASGSLRSDATALDLNRRKSSGVDMIEPPQENTFNDRRKSVPASRLVPSPLEERDENENFLTPPDRTITNRTGSILSRLSSELTASEEGEEMECVKCGSHDFRAKRVGGQQRLLCGKCGRMVDV
ncbi:WD40 repeat-like protein [Xylariaceae sp. FL1651]|nr:WD40 repeat-like protein [Xylariaceae sp. FL1651]